MSEPMVVWRDGDLIPYADATCHVMSHMTARGSQVFDVVLVTPTEAGPCALGLRAHVARFLRSAELMLMEDVGSLGAIERAVATTVLANAEIDDREAGGPWVVKIIAGWMEEAVAVGPVALRPTVHVVA